MLTWDMKVSGHVHNLEKFQFRTVVKIDPFTPETLLYIMDPIFNFESRNGMFDEVIFILTHPKNMEAAQTLSDQHNAIYDSPLMEALRDD